MQSAMMLLADSLQIFAQKTVGFLNAMLERGIRALQLEGGNKGGARDSLRTHRFSLQLVAGKHVLNGDCNMHPGINRIVDELEAKVAVFEAANPGQHRKLRLQVNQPLLKLLDGLGDRFLGLICWCGRRGLLVTTCEQNGHRHACRQDSTLSSHSTPLDKKSEQFKSRAS